MRSLEMLTEEEIQFIISAIQSRSSCWTDEASTEMAYSVIDKIQ